MSSKVAPVQRFKDESIGGLRRGPLNGEKPDKTTILYQARINGEVYSGIRLFSRISKYLSFFKLKRKELRREVEDNWRKLFEFVGRSPAWLKRYYPKKLTLVYGFADIERFNYSAVFTCFGTFTFVEASTEEAVSLNLPVRDLTGRDLDIATALFSPTLHSYLSLKVLNLIGG